MKHITVSGAIILRVNPSTQKKETLNSVDWLPADQLILEKIEEIL